MSRPMFYPMGTMAVGDSATMPADKPGMAKRTSRNVSQFGQRHDKHFICRTKDGLTTITRMR
jgi:hypothetical protein